MLAKLGVTPTVVTIGHDAVEAVTGAAHDGGGTYDVVLMDVEMPVMDGLCAVGRIRHDLGSAPSDGPLASDHGLLRREGHDRLPWFIALTANALSGDRERFLEGGMDDYLAKPFTLQALEAALDRSRTVPA